jgi:pimeloyl-ACP methyl ester carboxylesterase
VLERCPVEEITTAAGRLTLRRAGAGAGLVLLHGIGSGAASWAWQLDGLADRYHMTAWNAPGYGGSTLPAADWPDAGDYAAALDALLAALEIERCVLVGHSLGALIAARLAAEHSERVAGLVLADPAAGHRRLDEADRRQRLDARIGRFRDLGPVAHAVARAPRLLSPDATADQLALVRDNMERLDDAGYLKAARLLAGGDILADVARIERPALVICGAVDQITPPAGCRTVAEAFARPCPFVEIPGAGHASYIEAPSVFNAILEDFMGSLT